MILIKQSAEYIDEGAFNEESPLQVVYKKIEMAARTCYKSVSKDGVTPEDFVNKLITMKHYAMLEHGTVYLKYRFIKGTENPLDKYRNNPYSKVHTYYEEAPVETIIVYITTNYRVLVENNWLDDLKFICPPSSFHPIRMSVRVITDRAVAQEITRHRAFSFAMESQRYCNYSKDKFGNEVTFIIPSWVKDPNNLGGTIFINSCKSAEAAYLTLLKSGASPQQARAVLPNATKTELIITGFYADWEHFFDLRMRGTTGAPHPDMKELAVKIYNVIK